MEFNKKELEFRIADNKEKLSGIKKEIAKVIVGQERLVKMLLSALLARGHILLEGVPGLAKTTAISTLAKIINLNFKRIQFTPDLLPSDLIGSRVFNPKDSSFYVKKGPIFSNFILADEINRSPAKVQSALLEAMEEKQVTIGEETFGIKEPFFVMATQNPIEQEGTYPLPEAQVDRFLFKTVIEYPNKEEELEIINRLENNKSVKIKSDLGSNDLSALQELTGMVYIDESIKKYIVELVQASRFPKEINRKNKEINNMIAYGASPRASIGLMRASKASAFLDERAFVIPEDVKDIAMDVLRHRIIPTYEAEAEGVKSEAIVKMLLDSVKVP